MFTVDHVYKFCFHQGSYHYELMMRVIQFKVLSHTVSKFLFITIATVLIYTHLTQELEILCCLLLSQNYHSYLSNENSYFFSPFDKTMKFAAKSIVFKVRRRDEQFRLKL